MDFRFPLSAFCFLKRVSFGLGDPERLKAKFSEVKVTSACLCSRPHPISSIPWSGLPLTIIAEARWKIGSIILQVLAYGIEAKGRI